jgi:hypothetical protein
LATNNGRFEDLARSKVVLPSKALLKGLSVSLMSDNSNSFSSPIVCLAMRPYVCNIEIAKKKMHPKKFFMLSAF